MKETNSIIKMGLAARVIILSSGQKNQLKEEKVSDRISVYRIKSIFGFLPQTRITKTIFYLELYLRSLLFGLRLKADIINCHSLMMLPVAVLLKRIGKRKLIYDPHELETERLGLHGVGKKISKWIEKKLIYSTDAVVVVSGSICQWYMNTYDLKTIFTIRNIPQNTSRIESNVLKEKFNIPKEHQLFIYQGLINVGRSIEMYIDVFTKLPAHQHLVIMGYGPQESLVKDSASRFSNIHFHSAVKPSEILYYTCSADVGLSVIENYCLSYYYSLPNKVFEYIMAEIPLIVSNFPDMTEVVKTHDIGWPVDVSSESLITVIRSLTDDELARKKENIKKVKNKFSWENEEVVLRQVFDILNPQ